MNEELEGLVQLVVDVLGLHLFGDQVVHDAVDAEVQLLHSLLTILGPGTKCSKRDVIRNKQTFSRTNLDSALLSRSVRIFICFLYSSSRC